MAAFPQFGINYSGQSAGIPMHPIHSPNCEASHSRDAICTCQYERMMMNINSYRSYLAQSPIFPNLSTRPVQDGNPLVGSLPVPVNPANVSLPHHPHDMPLYPPMGGVYEGMKEEGAAGWRPAFNPYLGDPAMAAAGIYANNPYCQNNFANMDPSGMNRRKNATRETTSQLKQWLYEHRKNPYPTKSEKIWLAISTRMTITQVSTWFANARRRLKKENKMTWSPRNRACEDDDDDKSDLEMDGDEHIDVKDDESLSEMIDDEQRQKATPSSESREDGVKKPVAQEAAKPDGKPRIWSLADLATSAPSVIPTHPNQQQIYQNNFDRTRPFPPLWPHPHATAPMFNHLSHRPFLQASNSAFSSPHKLVPLPLLRNDNLLPAQNSIRISPTATDPVSLPKSDNPSSPTREKLVEMKAKNGSEDSPGDASTKSGSPKRKKSESPEVARPLKIKAENL